MGPDGIDAVIAATHEEGSTTINQQKIQSHASRQDYVAAVYPVIDNVLSVTATETVPPPPMVGGVQSLSATETIQSPHGGAIAPDDDFEGDIITM